MNAEWEERACQCEGCDRCAGRELGCTCDVDLDQLDRVL